MSPLHLAPLLAAAAATVAAAAACTEAALAASGGSTGGCSDDDSSCSFSSSYSDDSSTSDSWSSSSSPTMAEAAGDATHVSVGTSAELSPQAKRWQDMVFMGVTALFVAGVAAIFYAALHCSQPRTTVIKLQVALRGVAAAKSFQKGLKEIAAKVDVTDSWKEHFNKISIEERSKFDEETFSNLDGIKRKRNYSKRIDGSRNEYIVLTILIAAQGALKFPKVRSSADLEAAVATLNYIPEGEIQGIHVLWTPQEENDVLSEEELREDYPYLKPLS